MYNRKYDKIFIMMKQETYGYGGGQKQISGNASIEIRNGKGKLITYVQGLRQLGNGIYKVYLIAGSVGKALGIGTCLIEIDKKGQGNAKWEFDAENVGGTQLPIEDFNIVALIAEEPGSLGNSIIAPLVGYRDGKTNWKDHFIEYKKGTVRKAPEKKTEQNAAIEEKKRPEQSSAIEEKEKPEQSSAIEEKEKPEQSSAIEEKEKPEQSSAIEEKEKPEQNTVIEEKEKPEQSSVTEEKKKPEQSSVTEEKKKPEQNAVIELEKKKSHEKITEEKSEQNQKKNSLGRNYLFQEKIGDFQNEKEGTLQTIPLDSGLLEQMMKSKEVISFFHTEKKKEEKSQIQNKEEKAPPLQQEKQIQQEKQKTQKAKVEMEQKEIKNTIQEKKAEETKKQDISQKSEQEKQVVLEIDEFSPHDTFREITMKFQKEMEELEKAGIFTKEELRSIEKKGAQKKNSDLDYIFANNEKMKPFPNKDENKWIRICVEEMVLLPISHCDLMRHPFVISGYQKYKHLLLGKKKKGDREQFIFGVPDAYLPEYKMKAAHLGFQEFWCRDGRKQPTENSYGYWVMHLE